MIHVGKSVRLFQVVAACFALAATAHSQEKTESKQKRPITTADGIGMTRLEAPDYYSTNPSLAHFSPDGKRFVIVLRKGNLELNTNEFSILLYQTSAAFRPPKPDVLLTMSSSSNRDAVAKVRWLTDEETLVFLAENPGEVPQIYTFNVSSRLLKKLTNHPTAITNFDITGDGRQIAYMADPPKQESSEEDYSSTEEIHVAGQNLRNLLTGNYSRSAQLFSQTTGNPRRQVPLGTEYFVYPGEPISLAPNGRYIVFSAPVRNPPAEWASYGDPDVRYSLAANFPKGRLSPLQQFVLLETKDMSLAPLLNVPRRSPTLYWAPDGNAVFLTSYLPLDTADPAERKAREQNKFPIEVKLPAREYRKVRKQEFPTGPAQDSPIEVTLGQDLNTPPKIYVSNTKTQAKTLLLDLNPQFSELDFGHVKTIEWEVDGVDLIAGLYLPPDYSPGHRYPVVIQTHGFEPENFSMDGTAAEWSSAYAARAFAARDVVVLQCFHFKDHAQIDRLENDKSLGATVGESILHFQIHALEAAINYLDAQGVIDRNRVGISGFSRWVCFVGYTLTHSKYRFAAASLVDGVSCGYLEEVALPEIGYDIDNLMGGAPPFGEGLKLWMKNSPGFNLDKVQTPVQLATFGKGSVLEAWEWYVGLSLLKRPVDFVYVPDAIHIGVKPSERVSAQQRVLDWFSFWLNGIENPDPAKGNQYTRWRQLRNEYRGVTSPSGVTHR